MLSNIFRYIEPLRNVNIITRKADQFVNNLFLRSTNFIDRTYRYAMPTITTGMETLLSILFKCDLEKLLSSDSHEDRLFYIRTYILPMFESYTTTMGNVTKSEFTSVVGSSTVTHDEIMFISYNSHPSKIYEPYFSIPAVNRSTYIPDENIINNDFSISNFDNPLYSSIDNFRLKPFDIISMGGTELSLDLKTTKLRFVNDLKYIIFNLDIEKFILGALYYADRYPPNIAINWYNYIYQFCILPTCVDTINHWLINILEYTISQKKILDPNNTEDTKNLNIDYSKFFVTMNDTKFIFTTKDNFISDIKVLTDKLIQNQITPDALMDNYGLLTYSSITEFISYLISSVELHDTIDQRWRIFLSQLNLIKLVVTMYENNDINHPRTRNLKIKMNILLMNIERQNIVSKIRNQYLRKHVEDELNKMLIRVRNT